MPHADDQLKTFPVAHPVLVRDLSVIVENATSSSAGQASASKLSIRPVNSATDSVRTPAA